jgi:hypothetical protein
MNVYETSTIAKTLSANTYPGRGIIVGLTADGSKAITAYFIMGRSVNSRNRVVIKSGDDIIIHPYDPAKLTDPSLVIYSPVRKLGDKLIVTNGDQTDTIYDFIAAGKDFDAALNTREFEPDAPNYTPRISALLDFSNNYTYKMNILRSVDAEGSACTRYTFAYPATAGLAHFIHTYAQDGDPLPSFAGEPERLAIGSDIDEITREIWESLNADNKVSLFVRTIELAAGNTDDRIINAQEAAK